MWWYSTWQSPTTADCGLVESRINIALAIDADLFPEEAVERTTKNLRSFCCEQNILRNTATTKTCDDADIPSNGYFPQSTYLFDHIVDIMLRRLDGNEDLIYPDVPVYEIGKQWRDGIRKYSMTPAGVTPIELVNFINTYWNAGSVLRLQYDRVCKTAYDMYEKVAKNSPWAAATARIKNSDICTNMVQDKKNYELLYARTVINLMANQSLRTFMSTNLLDYYANNRLIALQSTITEMVGAFTTVNRFVVEGTRMCSM